jgi:hypothetical protein
VLPVENIEQRLPGSSWNDLALPLPYRSVSVSRNLGDHLMKYPCICPLILDHSL